MVLSFALDMFPYCHDSQEIDPNRIRNITVKDKTDAIDKLAAERQIRPLSVWHPQLFTDEGELIERL